MSNQTSNPSKHKIYTRTGDGGETSLYGGGRVLKDDPYIKALGTVDEFNCTLGWAVSLIPTTLSFNSLREQLTIIQHALFDLGAALATPRTKASEKKIEATRFDSSATSRLESWIDQFEEMLPELKTFILPGGHPAGAALHLARAQCRRVERRIIPLRAQGDVSEGVLKYINRLSDYLFVAARLVNHELQCAETPWHHTVGIEG